MKDTYCEYCNKPYFPFRVNVNGYTDSDIVARVDEEDNTRLDIGVFHTGATSGTMIYDGSFSISIKYCPACGQKVAPR